MSFQDHGQMLHGLNCYNLLIGLEILDLRIPFHIITLQLRLCFKDSFVNPMINLNLKSSIPLVLMFGQQFRQLLGRYMI